MCQASLSWAVGRRHACESEQAETWERGDDFIAFDKAGEGEAEFGKFGIVGANAAHSDEAEGFHGEGLMR